MAVPGPRFSRLRRRVLCGTGLLIAATGAWGQEPGAEAPRFDRGERWRHYVYRTYSWQRMSFLAADTAFDQLTGDTCYWGREPRFYGYRYASAFGRRVTRNSLELGFGLAFDEDARFRPSRRSGLGRRLTYAAAGSVGAYRGERRVLSYSRLLATLGGVAAASLWDPQPVTPGRFFGRAGSGYLGHLQNSLLTEFGEDLKAFGRRVRSRLLPAKEIR